ncbi:MAG: BrnA antitoxin family protein [Devosia sp.]|nr:BrnA antitoxin family protein [Devosia sp.]
MKRDGHIVSYTADEIREMIARGEDESDWARADAMTEEELEAAIASDPDEAGIVWDTSIAWTSLPPPPSTKKAISLRLDPDILAFFREGGRRYQTRINGVLRAYMDAQNRASAKATKLHAGADSEKLPARERVRRAG